MSAGIETFEEFGLGNDKAAFVGRLVAWHVLGKALGEAATEADVMEPNVLGWPTDKHPLTVVMPDGSTQEMPGQFIIYRNHAIKGLEAMAIVGKRYRDFDNKVVVDLARDIIDVGGACFESAGSMFGGKRVFVCLRIPKEISTAYGPKITPNLVITNTHDGSSQLEGLVTTVDVVCQNTLAMAFGEAKSRFKIRHTTNADMRLSEARKTLGLTFTYLEAVEQRMAAMIEQKFWEAEFEAMTKELLPLPQEIKSDETIMHVEKEREKLLYLRTEGLNKEYVDTAWGAYGAVTEYADWYSPIRAKDHTIRRAENVMTGAQEAFKKQAMDFILSRAAA